MTKAAQNETFHRLTIAAMIGSLENLEKILVKAEAHARASKIEPDVLLGARLYPDMFSLIQQLQYALYLPMDFARHFTDEPAPHVGYEEASFEDVHASLKIAIAYLKAIPREPPCGTGPTRGADLSLTAQRECRLTTTPPSLKCRISISTSPSPMPSSATTACPSAKDGFHRAIQIYANRSEWLHDWKDHWPRRPPL